MRLILVILALAGVAAWAFIFASDSADAPSEDPAPEVVSGSTNRGTATTTNPGTASTTNPGTGSTNPGTGSTMLSPLTPCPGCNQDAGLWTKFTANPPPQLRGKSAALIEASCGRLIYGQEANVRRPAASLMKIVTSMVVVENARPTDIVDIHVNGWRMAAEDGSSIMGLEEGMRLPVEELLYGLLFRSGNDAAVALSDHLGPRALELLNAKVKNLGLTDTALQNAHGLDAEGAYSSPFDMAILGRELLNIPYLRSIVSSKYHATDWSPPGMENGNWFMYIYPGAVGVKTGYTDAARGTIVSAVERDGRLLILSVFDSSDVFVDSTRVFDWAFANVPAAC
jgi:serine-type D-Ala-D-Ala carboxypeptidase (penicillin-binding protein 5/6)